MAEWLFEAGIGETRAALIEDGAIAEAVIEPDDGGLRVGTVLPVRLIERSGARGIVEAVEGAFEALIDPLPPATELGRAFMAMVVREALTEPGTVKRAKVRAAPDQPACTGLALYDRVAATAMPVTILTPHGPDLLEAAGWSELLEEARSGLVPFAGGRLRISLTPAMTLIDVDGELPPAALALVGARAAAAAIRRFGIAGNIGIDLPTVAGKGARLAQAQAVDALLPPPFERTAVNGFGFLQIVRPRPRASLIEYLVYTETAAQARALIRRAERSGLIGAAEIVAAPGVSAVFDANPAYLDALSRHLGGNVTLRADPLLAISAGYVTKAP